MIDTEIQQDIEKIKDYVSGINILMDSLYDRGVEIRIAYKDSTSGSPTGRPCLELWRATEHIDYLKRD